MDDVVGCVELGLDQLRSKSLLNGWQPIMRPLAPLGLLGLMWQAATGKQPQAELKLTVTMEGANVGCSDNISSGCGNLSSGNAIADFAFKSHVSGEGNDRCGGGSGGCGALEEKNFGQNVYEGGGDRVIGGRKNRLKCGAQEKAMLSKA